MKRILDGVRVIDFTDAMAGPFCARYLADCGCEVINIEKPEGKVARVLPYFQDGHSGEYIQNHCGKKSIAVNLKAKGARDLMLGLAKVSDVVLENFSPGVMGRLGLDYESFREINPKIIMCSISGWGQTGPDARNVGVDLLIQASRGVAHMSTEPGKRPTIVSFAVSDILAGLNAFGAICAALYRRAITGEGENIDIAMADCTLASLGNAVGAHILSKGRVDFRQMIGSFSPDFSPDGVYQGRDGFITVFCRTDEQWAKMAELMGKPELATDPRFHTVADRVEHNEEVTKEIDDWLRTKFEKVKDASDLLQHHHILSSPVLSIANVVDEDLQTAARGMIVNMEHPTLGPFRFLNTPLRFQNNKAHVEEPPPVIVGEHTEYVLHHLLKLDDNTVNKLIQDGVVPDPNTREK